MWVKLAPTTLTSLIENLSFVVISGSMNVVQTVKFELFSL
jgi:hypothetical protein